MKISIENADNPITEFKIRHKGANLNFAWIRENPARPFPSAKLSRPNLCEICIDDVFELESVLYMLERAKKKICGMIGHSEEIQH